MEIDGFSIVPHVTQKKAFMKNHHQVLQVVTCLGVLFVTFSRVKLSDLHLGYQFGSRMEEAGSDIL